MDSLLPGTTPWTPATVSRRSWLHTWTRKWPAKVSTQSLNLFNIHCIIYSVLPLPPPSPLRYPVNTATSLKRPLYTGRKKLSQSFSYLKNPFSATIPLIRPIFHCREVVVLTGSTVLWLPDEAPRNRSQLLPSWFVLCILWWKLATWSPPLVQMLLCFMPTKVFPSILYPFHKLSKIYLTDREICDGKPLVTINQSVLLHFIADWLSYGFVPQLAGKSINLVAFYWKINPSIYPWNELLFILMVRITAF